jgi:hypothetical protein
MASPTWSTPNSPLLVATIAAAVHHAWEQPTDQRTRAFHDRLRQLLDADMYERVQTLAHDLFLLQAAPPGGLDIPPEWAWFEACPRCTRLRKTKYTAPQNGRLKLQALRDPNWCAKQIDAGRTTRQIADQLGCTSSLVVDWLRKHGIQTEKALRHEEIEQVTRRMHAEGEGPGAIAKVLGHSMTADRVRDVLKRLGLANQKNGHVYHEREWWRMRLEDQGKSKLQCAREAGIKPHAASYWLKRFGLRDRVWKRRQVKYPILADRQSLRELLFCHGGSYEAAAREVGCAPSLVSWYARRLLGIEKRHENRVPHSDRTWWEERLAKGTTTYELAEEAGIEEKSAREKLRVLELLPQAYANNMKRERARRGAA